MKNALFLFTLTCAAVCAAADPSATVTALARNEQTGLVTVDYTLANGPAIITADVLTNGVSVGRLRRTMIGDVNRLVTNATGRIHWFPRPEKGGFALGAAELSVSVKAYRPDDPPAYMVVRLDLAKTRFYYECEDALPHGIEGMTYRVDSLLMRRIPAGGATFTMGSRRDEPNRSLTYEIGHRVSFTNDFYIGVFEFTHEQALRFAANVYGTIERDSKYLPQDKVGYEGMLRGWRNHGYKWPQTGHTVVANNSYLFYPLRTRTGLLFDLPTESQWEFAARAGSTTALPFGLTITNATADATLGEFAWYRANAEGIVHPVGLKRPNAWGLYDVLGNLNEMTLDVWSNDNTVYGEIDPPGYETEARDPDVMRGGNYTSASGDARLGKRVSVAMGSTASETYGFRVWCPVPDETVK